MSTSDPVLAARGRIAYYSRPLIGDPQKVAEARRDLAVAKLERHIREVVEAAPLTQEQRDRLAALLIRDGEAK